MILSFQTQSKIWGFGVRQLDCLLFTTSIRIRPPMLCMSVVIMTMTVTVACGMLIITVLRIRTVTWAVVFIYIKI